MNTTELAIWALLLLIQNFSFTLVSRARNSGSVGFHAIVAIGSNGIWFASQFILFANFLAYVKSAHLGTAVFIGVFYTTFTVLGSVSSHFLSMHYFERGKRKLLSEEDVRRIIKEEVQHVLPGI